MTALPATRRRRLLPSLCLMTGLMTGLVTAAPAAPLLVTAGGGLNSYGASLSADGSRLAFYSASNLTGGNADHNFEIFVYERATAQLRQVTDMPGGIQAGGQQQPALSGDGSRLAFQRFEVSGSTARFRTQTLDLGTGSLTNVTPLGDFFEASAISRDGGTIAVSTGNLGLRLYDTATQSFSAVLMPAPFDFTMSGDGRRLAYEGFSQGVRLLDRDTGVATVVSPAGSGFNQRPVLSDDGNSLAFVSTFDPLGLNADHNSEVFRYDLPTQTLQQITRTLGGGASSASLSGDGSRIAFTSAADLTGENADGNREVFVYDLLAGDFLQVSHTVDTDHFDAVLSADGRTLAFGGMQARGPAQVFLDALPPQQRGELPEPASLALVLAALGLLRGARRRRPGRG